MRSWVARVRATVPATQPLSPVVAVPDLAHREVTCGELPDVEPTRRNRLGVLVLVQLHTQETRFERRLGDERISRRLSLEQSQCLSGRWPRRVGVRVLRCGAI